MTAIAVPLELIDALGGMMIKCANDLQETYTLPQILQAYWYSLGYLVGASGGIVLRHHTVLEVDAFAMGYAAGCEAADAAPGVQ